MLTVFIADDSVLIRGRLKETLDEYDSIEVIGESGNTKQAITEIRQLNPDVVIIDIRMPGGGGLPILKDLKKREPKRIAIILTAFPLPQYRQAYMEAGADFFFDKTQDIQKLIDVLVELAMAQGDTLDE
jgi:DNA-binding NarL/FixJ family response regulator